MASWDFRTLSEQVKYEIKQASTATKKGSEYDNKKQRKRDTMRRTAQSERLERQTEITNLYFYSSE